MWNRIIWLFLLFLLGRHLCFPSSPRYLELADSADYFISREKWDLAESKILEALRLEPANFTNSLLLANLGLIQTHKGEYVKAVQTLSLGINIAPSSTVLLNNRAHAYLMLDSIAQAALDLDRSLSIDSLQSWSLQTRAFIYLSENNIGDAKRLFLKLKKEFPENTSVYNGFASIAEQEGNYEEAKKYYLEALNLNKEDEEAREAFIFLLIKTNSYSEARAQIRQGLEINPENPIYYLLRGYLHRLNFRIDEAEADKKIAISKGLDAKYVASFIP
ncbi:MAG: tetratricopeptide repeat protein [Muribaculaceae bacterium]|nr:tetratricopeptide repeat protein [Muribaculaceae bacterium]